MSHPTDPPLGYSDEYYLAMAALDCYLNDGGPFKSTSVIYRIHLLGLEARLRAASPGAPEMLMELRSYLDTLNINRNNIGNIRGRLFVPWESQWNGWVRDETAKREHPAEPTPPKEQP